MTRVALTTLLVGSLLAGGCGGAAHGGDPGDERLHALQADPTIRATPPAASDVSRTSTAAVYRKGGFEAGGWRGPSVTVVFTSSADPADVFRFYAARAQASGWTPTARGSLGVDDRWRKTFDGGAKATLFLARESGSSYRLLAGIAPQG